MIKSEYSTRYDSDSEIEQIAFKRQDGSIVLIVINDGNNDVSIRLKGFRGSIRHILTDADNNWKEKNFKSKRFIDVGAKSINTYILTGKK